jgi:uncharacterized protein YegJ (DUF2314 family)
MTKLPIQSVVVAIALACASASASAGDLAGIHSVPTGDRAMIVAAGKAQAGLDDFLAKLANPPDGTSNYAIKVGIIDRPNGYALTSDQGVAGVEYFWLTDIVATRDGFLGQLGNDPELVRNVHFAEQIPFRKSDIFDWLYFDNGQMKGNFTACPALLRGPPEELRLFREQFGMDCR